MTTVRRPGLPWTDAASDPVGDLRVHVERAMCEAVAREENIALAAMMRTHVGMISRLHWVDWPRRDVMKEPRSIACSLSPPTFDYFMNLEDTP